MNILGEIIAHKKLEVAGRKKKRPLESFIDALVQSDRDFKKTLAGGRDENRPRLIAEIKKASPSEKLLRPRLETELAEITAIYNRRASAISVVTDEHFFQGQLEWIKKIRQITHLPILCKDFIVDEYQIYEARSFGADAILLIAAVLDAARLKKFIKIAGSLGMGSLVEVRSQTEIKTAVKNFTAEIIGINNRNLETFETSLETTLALAPLIPKNRVIVSESGFRAKKDIQKVSTAVDAILIGTRLMKTKNMQKQLEMLGFSPQLNHGV